jgi:ATP-dependent Lon protease
LLSHEEEEVLNKEDLQETLPILPLRNTVLFPGVVIPITVGRDKSIQLLKEAYKSNDKLVGVVTQLNAETEDPMMADLYAVGTMATIVRMIKMPDGSTMAVIQGKRRFQLNKQVQENPYLVCEVSTLIEDEFLNDDESLAMIESIKEVSQKIISMSPHMPSEAAIAIKNIKTPNYLVNFVASNLNAEVIVKQGILELLDFKSRASKVMEALNKDYQFTALKAQIESKVRGDLDKQQRDFFLQQQIKAIQEELGGDSPEREIENMMKLASQKIWSEQVNESFLKEVEKLRRINPMAPDYSIQLNYLQLLLELPWNEITKDQFDLKRAQKILDEDHFGLEKVKQRILEYLAVIKLKKDLKSPILCLYGPPGVGKTSLGKSIAKDLDR